MSMIIFSTKLKERKMISKKEKSFHCIASRAIDYFRWYTVFVCHFVVVVDFFCLGEMSPAKDCWWWVMTSSAEVICRFKWWLEIQTNEVMLLSALRLVGGIVLWWVARMVSNDWYISIQLVSINHIRLCSVMFKNDPE